MAEIAEIVAKLIERTDQGQLVWKSSVSEQSFYAMFSSVSVTISKDFGPYPTLRILDKTGREIYLLDSQKSHQWREQLGILHEKARWVALDVASQLDELLTELEKV